MQRIAERAWCRAAQKFGLGILRRQFCALDSGLEIRGTPARLKGLPIDWRAGSYKAPVQRDGALCLLMEYCDGGSVSGILGNYGALSWRIIGRCVSPSQGLLSPARMRDGAGL